MELKKLSENTDYLCNSSERARIFSTSQNSRARPRIFYARRVSFFSTAHKCRERVGVPFETFVQLMQVHPPFLHSLATEQRWEEHRCKLVSTAHHHHLQLRVLIKESQSYRSAAFISLHHCCLFNFKDSCRNRSSRAQRSHTCTIHHHCLLLLKRYGVQPDNFHRLWRQHHVSLMKALVAANALAAGTATAKLQSLMNL